MFTHTVLYASPSPDDFEERGAINRDAAVALFRSFPFEAEHRKRATDDSLTVPTLTFTDATDESTLTIWSPDPGEFVVWATNVFEIVHAITDPDDVIDCLELFFDRDAETLGIKMIHMMDKYA